MQQSKPYYAVIFTSKQSKNTNGYAEMAIQMEKLAKTQKGYLGIVSAKNEIGITISYWESLEAITLWKNNAEHLIAQGLGKSKWYDWYDTKICEVIRDYKFTR